MATVLDILGRKGGDVVTMAPDDSVLDAARTMNERGIGSVVVLKGSEVAGIFTERDILRRVVAEEKDPAATKLSDVMTSPVIACRPEARLEECAALFTEKRVRHLPVADEEGLKGMITSGDILAHQIKEHEDTIEFLNSYVFDLRS